jgi:hypothetical protein
LSRSRFAASCRPTSSALASTASRCVSSSLASRSVSLHCFGGVDLDLDRAAAHPGKVVDQEPCHPGLCASFDQRLGERVAGAAGEGAADGGVGEDVAPGHEHAFPPGTVQRRTGGRGVGRNTAGGAGVVIETKHRRNLGGD